MFIIKRKVGAEMKTENEIKMMEEVKAIGKADKEFWVITQDDVYVGKLNWRMAWQIIRDTMLFSGVKKIGLTRVLK